MFRILSFRSRRFKEFAFGGGCRSGGQKSRRECRGADESAGGRTVRRSRDPFRACIGVFFHEIFGHRVEGHRQKDESEGQTFTKSVGEQILPDFLSVTFDPTIKSSGHRPQRICTNTTTKA